MVSSDRWIDLLWILAFGVASSAWCLTAAERVGATFDEPFYIKAGLTKWRTGSNRLLMRAGTMTLPVDVQTLPIHLWERVGGCKYQTEADLPAVLPTARAANLVFWWLLLVYAMRLGLTFGGHWGGRLAVALTACDPNLLGHASLATTDIASTAIFLVLVYHFWHGLGRSWPRRVAVPGLCLAMAIQAKVSGLVFGLEAMVVMGLWHLAGRGELVPPARLGLREQAAQIWHACYPLRRDLTVIVTVGLILVFVYTGSDWTADPNFVRWAESLPEGGLKSVMDPLSHHLTIFSNAGEGLVYQFLHNLRGHDTFLLGEWHHHATPAYFPVALTMKLPLPVFALLAAALWYYPRQFLTPVAGIALLMLALSPNYRVQIGIRFLFPMIVLGYVALGAAVACGWSGRPRSGRAGLVSARIENCDLRIEEEAVTRLRFNSQFSSLNSPIPTLAVTSLLLASVATAAWIWPRGLCYFNQPWGGPDAGATLLHESNYDWGQGLPELRAWCEAHGEDRIAVWYYGMDPDVQRTPFIHIPLHNQPENLDVRRIRAAAGDARYLAVSVGCFCLDVNITPHFREAINWVRTQTPVARTTCFWIYQMD